MKKPFIALIIALVSIFALLSPTLPIQKTGATEYEVVEFGGILRVNSSGTWYLFSDTYHNPINLGTVTQDSDSIIVDYTSGIDRVNWISISPDESLVLRHVDTGGSVWIEDVNIFLAKDGVIKNPNTFNSTNYPEYASINIWIYIRGERAI